MKKIISFVLAFALVLSMGVCAFAAERPADEDITVETLGAYYVEALNEEGADIPALAQEFVDDMALFSDPADIVRLTTIISQGVSTDVLNAFITEIENIVGVTIPLPGEPSTSEEDSSLEEDTSDGEEGGSGSFLDTILGVLGGLGDILFGDGSDTQDPSDDPFPTEPTTDSNPDGSQVPNGGDTTIVSVAAVALVAGAALVLTRKKNDDAE